jgi:hypothetical protein
VTSFHHQPEAQHPKSSNHPQQRRPITPSLGQERTHAPQHDRRKKKDRLAAVSPKCNHVY